MNESATTVSTTTISNVGAGLPDGWVWKTMGEICNTASGGTPSRATKEYFKGNIPWVKSGELPDGLIIETEEYITEEAVKNSSAKIFPSGTLLIAMYGATVGKLGIINREAATNQAVCAIFPHKELDTKYLFWYLKSLRADLISKSLGGAQPNISQGILRNIPFPLAPLNQQNLIVAEIEKQFSRLDEAVAALKRIQANLKRYKASVLKAAVEGKLTEEWRKKNPKVEPASELLKRILTERRKKWEEDYVNKYVGAHGHAPNDDSWKKKYKEPASPDTSNLPELPEGWVRVNLDSICHQIGDVDHKMPKAKDSGIPYISTKDFLPAGEIDYENAKKIGQADYDKLCRKIFPEYGDILLSRYGTVGEVRLVKTENLFQASYSIAILKPVSENMQHFLSLVLQTEPIQRQIKKHTRATAQPDLGLAHIRLLDVPIAPTDERKRIIEEIDRLFSVTEEIEAIIQANTKRAERLRQAILIKAFSGKLI